MDPASGSESALGKDVAALVPSRVRRSAQLHCIFNWPALGRQTSLSPHIHPPPFSIHCLALWCQSTMRVPPCKEGPDPLPHRMHNISVLAAGGSSYYENERFSILLPGAAFVEVTRIRSTLVENLLALYYTITRSDPADPALQLEVCGMIWVL